MTITINKAHIAKTIAKNIGISQSVCEAITNSLFEEIILLISKDKILKIKNFGTFRENNKAARFGFNINHKIPITINSRQVISFSAADKLKKFINQELTA